MTDADSDEKYAQTKELNLLGQPKWPLWKTTLTFFALSLVMFLVCSAETAFNQILSPLKTEFNTSIFAQWMEASFLITCVMAQPIWVKLAEKFGRRWPLLISIFIFMVFSILVGAAHTMTEMCVGRAFQGIGGAGMMPLALVVLTDILTPGERGVYMGLLGAVIILGKWSGPIIGAAFYEKSTWRWTGYYNIIVGAAAIVILFFVLRDLPTPNGRVRRRLREFDYAGTVMWLGGSVMILLALSWGGNEHAWRSATIVCLFVCGFVAILLFALIEGRFARWPIIPLPLLIRPRVLLTLTVSFFIGFCLYGMIMFVPVYYMMVLGQGALESVRHILWFVLGGCIGAVGSGLLVTVRGRWFYREWAVVGTAMMAIGYGLMYTWPQDPMATGKHIGYQVFLGLGLGFCMQQVLLASQAGLPVNEISTVTTLIDYARTLGGMVGLVIGEVILKQKMFETVDKSGFGAFVGSSQGQDVVKLESMMPMLSMLPASITQPIYQGIVNALHLVFVVDVPFAGLACILCMFVSNIPLHVILPPTESDEVLETQRNLHSTEHSAAKDDITV
ncbi:hypothetical protein GGI25_004708 [Coemansia spiralis]|uniref:Major facilitator superfamily (MFS) profile domain-containing protein n=2 Tax=Coemansia TaxID=4863 RepID=A0A9W8G5L8_9FUNG|nr:major facilitator superfamily domain-containing protein [Coemansia spiralis]KAJ1989779.1 hypothetical protein EDC05_004479 [Coemansia umbellata]KAJ2621385.1 hypothetical protein GGI26_004167 [Coemansia sp. RSA 1358]KAJ2673446.1 hypothetical protein GGI25_004708 [Coemansia spiralis]